VRQQNSGAVEDFILPYSAVYLRIQKWKKLLKSVHICQSYRKNKSGTFFNGPRCIFGTMQMVQCKWRNGWLRFTVSFRVRFRV